AAEAVEESRGGLVVDLGDAVHALGGVRRLALLAEAADRPAQRHVAVVGRDGDRLVVDSRLPEELLFDVVTQFVIGHDVLLWLVSWTVRPRPASPAVMRRRADARR